MHRRACRGTPAGLPEKGGPVVDHHPAALSSAAHTFVEPVLQRSQGDSVLSPCRRSVEVTVDRGQGPPLHQGGARCPGEQRPVTVRTVTTACWNEPASEGDPGHARETRCPPAAARGRDGPRTWHASLPAAEKAHAACGPSPSTRPDRASTDGRAAPTARAMLDTCGSVPGGTRRAYLPE